jgi:hypothetical protein
MNFKFLTRIMTTALLVGMSYTAHAGYIYTYTGPAFTTWTGSYDASNFVTVQITLDEALQAGISNQSVKDLDGFSITMSDGRDTITGADSNVYQYTVKFTTGLDGAINGHRMLLWRFTDDADGLRTVVQLHSVNGRSGRDDLSRIQRHYLKGSTPTQRDIVELVVEERALAIRSSTQGVWDVTEVVKVGEPSTLAIFALGMIGLASRRFKKQS